LPIVGKANPSSKPRWGLALICVPIDILLLVGGFVAFYVGTPHWPQINTPRTTRNARAHSLTTATCAAHNATGTNVYGWCSFCSWIDCVPIADWCDSYKD
jgi:hypothetical protein